MIHIVFNTADKEVLSQAFELDEEMRGEIVEIKDDLGVGPLTGLDTDEGWNGRIEWWKGLLKGSPYGEELAGSFDDRNTVEELMQRLDGDENEQAWIWMGQNQHDVMGYFWLMPQLRIYQGRLMIIFLNNLPFINEKGHLFYPWGLSEILPKEAVKAKKLARPVTMSEFEIDPDEWKKLADENAMVRILEGGKKIIGKEANFYDNEILKNCSGEWQKASRLLSNTLNRMKIRTGDVFIMWRIQQLAGMGKLDVNGDINKGWKEFDVKLPGRNSEETENAESVNNSN